MNEETKLLNAIKIMVKRMDDYLCPKCGTKTKGACGEDWCPKCDLVDGINKSSGNMNDRFYYEIDEMLNI